MKRCFIKLQSARLKLCFQSTLVLAMLLCPPYAMSAQRLALPAPARILGYTKLLTLKDAVLLAVRQNPNILDTELDMVTDRFGLETAQNAFLPQFTLSGGLSTDNFKRITPNIAAGTSLKTPLGTTFGVGYTDDLAGKRGATVTVTQPLLQGFGLSLNEIDLQEAKDNLITTHLGHRDAISGIIVQVVDAYHSLMTAYQTLEDNEETSKVNKTTFKIAKIKYKEGRFSRNDMLTAEHDYVSSQYSLTQTKQTIFTQYQDFLQLIGLNPDSKLSISKKFSLKPNKINSFKKALAIALHNNTDYITAKLALKHAQFGIITAKNGLKWQLGLTNTTTLSLTAPNEPPGGTPTDNTTTLDLTVPLSSTRISARQGMVNAQITLTKAHRALTQALLTVKKTIRTNLQTIASDRQLINEAQQTLKLQQQAFKGTQLQWQYGKISTLTLTQTQSSLTLDQNNAINAQLTYSNAVADFYKYLGLTLKQWEYKTALLIAQ